MRTPLVLAVAAAVVLAPTPAFASAGTAPVEPVAACTATPVDTGESVTIAVAGAFIAPGTAWFTTMSCDIYDAITWRWYGGTNAAGSPLAVTVGTVVAPDVPLMLCTTFTTYAFDGAETESRSCSRLRSPV